LKLDLGREAQLQHRVVALAAYIELIDELRVGNATEGHGGNGDQRRSE
jgi:hypothetical protein